MSLPSRVVTGQSHILKFVRKAMPFLDIECGPWLAGGAARLISEDTDHIGSSDIDLFFPNQRLYDWTLSYMRDLSKRQSSIVFQNITELSKTHKIEFLFEGRPYTVQFVGKTFFDSVESLICDFDLTACMFATDGVELVWDEAAPKDNADRRMVVRRPNKKQTPARLAKYILHGFTPEPGVLTELLGVNLPNFKLNANLQADEY